MVVVGVVVVGVAVGVTVGVVVGVVVVGVVDVVLLFLFFVVVTLDRRRSFHNH